MIYYKTRDVLQILLEFYEECELRKTEFKGFTSKELREICPAHSNLTKEAMFKKFKKLEEQGQIFSIGKRNIRYFPTAKARKEYDELVIKQSKKDLIFMKKRHELLEGLDNVDDIKKNQFYKETRFNIIRGRKIKISLSK